MKHADFTDNKHVAFIHLSSSKHLQGNYYANANERILSVAVKDGAQKQAIQEEAMKIATVDHCGEETLNSSSASTMLVTIVPKDKQKITDFVTALQERGLLSEAETKRALYDLSADHIGVAR